MSQYTYNEFVSKLKINKHALDDELEVQASIQHMISEKLSRAREHMEMLENELEKVEARTYVGKSEQLLNGKKPSIEYIKSAVKSDGERTKKWIDFNAARAEHERWEGLYYAWRSRNDALQGLAKLAVANYFVVESTYEKDRAAIGRHHTTRPISRRKL